MRLIWNKQPVKALKAMQPKRAAKIRADMAAIAEDPLKNRRNVETIVGTDNGYRLRVGDLRVVYRIDNDTVHVVLIKSRGKVYKR